jgi:hypothetical protein
MERNSNAWDAARSFLSEKYLIGQRDVWSLSYKYEARERRALHGFIQQDRVQTLLDIENWFIGDDGPLSEYRKHKYIGGLRVDGRTGSVVSAFDPLDPDVRVRQGKKDAIQLHLLQMTGAEQVRADLRQAAEYISLHQPLRRTAIITGTTYEKMASCALRLHFRPMWEQSADEAYATQIAHFHQAVNAVNGRDDPFSLATVYMPTPEFIERFKHDA